MIKTLFLIYSLVLINSIAVQAQNGASDVNTISENGSLQTTGNYSFVFNTVNLESCSMADAAQRESSSAGQEIFKEQINDTTRTHIQQLQIIIEKQKKRLTEKENEYNLKITELKQQIAFLESRLNITNEGKDLTPGGSANTSLEQNNPNPVNDYATIRYTIPTGSRGQIIVYNHEGIIVKTITANKTGQSIINVKDMTTGIYNYSLQVNGKLVLSKQMIVAR